MLLGMSVSPACFAQVEIGFGPNPRSLDNLSVWNYDTRAERARWDRLRAAGVGRISVNAAFLMRHQLQLRKTGTPPAWIQRPVGTYVKRQEFVRMRKLAADAGFQFSYSGGIGLSGDRCSRIAADPISGGKRAATVEYNNILVPMLNAGIPIHEIAIDGPFLRLIKGSQKQYGCEYFGTGFGIDDTVQAVDAYLKELVDLISAHKAQSGISPDLVLIVNLPNWSLGKEPRITKPGADSFDLGAVLDAFRKFRELHGHKPTIRRFRIDYPYCIVQGVAPCAAGGANARNDTFVYKMAELWGHVQGMNGQGPGAVRATLSVAVNTHKTPHSCLAKDFATRDVNGKSYRIPRFLVYRRYDPQPTAPGSNVPPRGWTWKEPGPRCQTAQRGGDRIFMDRSETYARRIGPGGDLARAMNDRSRHGDVIIDKVVFQAWGDVPLKNTWYIDRLADYAD